MPRSIASLSIILDQVLSSSLYSVSISSSEFSINCPKQENFRLTPPVALVMWTYVALQRYMANGPYWSQSPDPFCGKSWWTNLLYVNNIVYPDESVSIYQLFINKVADGFDMILKCYGLVWYLANDMQFYIFAPLVLIPMFL